MKRLGLDLAMLSVGFAILSIGWVMLLMTACANKPTADAGAAATPQPTAKPMSPAPEPAQPIGPTTESLATSPAQPLSQTDLAASFNQFGFDLMGRLPEKADGRNVFISPVSVALALTMAWEGAQDETAEAMAASLGLDGRDRSDVEQAAAQLLAALLSADPKARLAIANSLWGNRQVIFQADYLERMRRVFSAQITSLDFSDSAAPAQINDWVSHNTNGKIPKIIEKLSPMDVLVLVNAVWFKGEWTDPFEPAATREAPFHLADGQQKSVALMRRQGSFHYLEGDGFQAVAIPYSKGRLRMIVVLPGAEIGLTELMERLDAETFKQWCGDMSFSDGMVALPKFKLEYEATLNDSLIALGMGLAFSDRADFSPMVAPPLKVLISEVKHKTFLDVNETGTEAAAATSVRVGMTRARPGKPFSMVIDRPFLCAIVDRTTGAILFLGAIMDPSL